MLFRSKGAISGAIGFEAIVEFIMYTYTQLRDNGFGYLQFIQREAFEALVNVTLYIVVHGIEGLMALGNDLRRASTYLMQPFRDAQAAEDFARRVKQRPHAVVFGTPEVKGAILYRLSERFTFSREEHQEGAIVDMMFHIQTRHEWEQVVERITPNGSKGSAAAGMARLRAVLDFGAQRMFEERLQVIMNTVVFDAIPAGDTQFAGLPNRFGSRYA